MKFVKILNSKICFPFKAKNSEDIECQVRFLLTANEYVFANDLSPFCPRLSSVPISSVSERFIGMIESSRRMIDLSVFIRSKKSVRSLRADVHHQQRDWTSSVLADSFRDERAVTGITGRQSARVINA